MTLSATAASAGEPHGWPPAGTAAPPYGTVHVTEVLSGPTWYIPPGGVYLFVPRTATQETVTILPAAAPEQPEPGRRGISLRGVPGAR